jgi:hypothetical protein
LNNDHGIAEHIRSLYQHSEQSEDQLDQDIIGHVLAVTMKFESIVLHGSRRNPATYLDVYHRWFHVQMIRALGNNLGRKRHLQPLSYAFVDVPASRGLQRNSTSEAIESGLLHIHAVIAVRPGKGKICRLPLLVAGSAHRSREFGDVQVKPFDPSLGSLENMIEYFKKGAEAIGSRCRSDCYDVFPRFRITRLDKTPSISPVNTPSEMRSKSSSDVSCDV